MSVLRRFERNLTAIVEGSLTRIFRSQVEVVEIARAITREIDSHTTVGLSHKYVPSHYTVWLSPTDRERFSQVEKATIDELVAYALEYTRQHKLTFATKPVIRFDTDEKLGLGEFGIETEEASLPQEQSSSPGQNKRRSLEQANTVLRLVLNEGETELALLTATAIVGRNSSCDVVIEDASISRKHAEFRRSENGGWSVVDLGSTNGTTYNRRKIQAETAVVNGDVLKFGKVAVRCLLQEL